MKTKRLKTEFPEENSKIEQSTNNINCRIENKCEIDDIDETKLGKNENIEKIAENPSNSVVEEKKSDNDSEYKSNECNDNDDDDDDDWSDDFYSTVETNSKTVERVRRKHVSYKKLPPYTCQSCDITFDVSIK